MDSKVVHRDTNRLCSSTNSGCHARIRRSIVGWCRPCSCTVSLKLLHITALNSKRAWNLNLSSMGQICNHTQIHNLDLVDPVVGMFCKDEFTCRSYWHQHALRQGQKMNCRNLDKSDLADAMADIRYEVEGVHPRFNNFISKWNQTLLHRDAKVPP